MITEIIIIAVTVVVLATVVVVIKTKSKKKTPDPNPVDCRSEWSNWSVCSKSCGPGTQTRTRRIIEQPKGNGKSCPTPDSETRRCNLRPCESKSVDCRSEWNDWSACSKSCGPGIQTRTRRIIEQPKGNGEPCPIPNSEARGCNLRPCKSPQPQSVDCKAEWSEWSACSKSCGPETQTRTRKIVEKPKGNGKSCPTPITETQNCNHRPCCKSGQWYGKPYEDANVPYPKKPPTPCPDGYVYASLDNSTPADCDMPRTDYNELVLRVLKDQYDKPALKDNEQCNACTDCGIAGVAKECTDTLDTACRSVCKSGTYSETGFEPCKTYTKCDGGIAVGGTYTTDVVCKTYCPPGTWGVDNNYGPPCFSPCPTGTYSDTGFGSQCFDCQDCGSDVSNKKCSIRSNTNCGSQPKPSNSPCPTGFYSPPGEKTCYKCQECDGGTVTECSPQNNTECVTCDKGHFYGTANNYSERNISVEGKTLDEVAEMRDMVKNMPVSGPPRCHKCQDCPVSRVKEHCTKISDAVCHPLCVPGKTHSKTGFEPCKPSTQCEHGIYESSYTSDNKCKSPCPAGTFGSSNRYGPPCFSPCPSPLVSKTGYGPTCRSPTPSPHA